MAASKTKGTKSTETTKPAKNGTLTGNEAKVLKALSSGAVLTREELRRKTGINKGWSRMLGASSKEDGGAAGDASLEGRGLITSDRPEGERAFSYKLTAAGRKALEKAK